MKTEKAADPLPLHQAKKDWHFIGMLAYSPNYFEIVPHSI